MGKKFDEIYETVLSRYVIGGYLQGDIVKLRKNYKSCDCYNAMPTVMQQELDDLYDRNIPLRVVQVGDRLSGASAGNQHKTADNAVITVKACHGGITPITVKPEMIDILDTNDPNVKIPDDFVWNPKTNFKAEEWKADMQNITRVTDKGDGKNTPTNIRLAGESVRITRDSNNIAMLYETLEEP